MKRFSIFLLLISFLLFTETLSAKQSSAKEDLDILAQKIKRGAERSKEFAFSQDTGNLLLFLASAGFLIYLPKHLSKHFGSVSRKNTLDSIIEWPHASLFSHTPWATHLYYELMTLLAGYICLKTGKPYWEKLKSR